MESLPAPARARAARRHHRPPDRQQGDRAGPGRQPLHRRPGSAGQGAGRPAGGRQRRAVARRRRRGSWASLPIVQQALSTGQPAAATEVVPAELLARRRSGRRRLASSLVDTPKASAHPFDPREGTAGLAMVGVSPITAAGGRIIGPGHGLPPLQQRLHAGGPDPRRGRHRLGHHLLRRPARLHQRPHPGREACGRHAPLSRGEPGPAGPGPAVHGPGLRRQRGLYHPLRAAARPHGPAWSAACTWASGWPASTAWSTPSTSASC